MRSEKVILLRHLVALLAVSTTAPSWIQFAQSLKFSPIKEITLGTEITVDWTGQPSLGNVEQSVVLMKDGNALLTLCQGQITGSGQCSFELKPEHQVLGDGYQLAMQGKDGVALDYSAEFLIRAGEVKVESSPGGGEKEEDEKGEDEGEDEDEDEGEQGEEDNEDENMEKENIEHDDHDDNEEDNEEDNNNNADNEAKKKQHNHGHQKSETHKKQAKNKKQQQQHHHHKKQQQNNKKQPKQHKQKQDQQQQRQKYGYYKQQADKLLKAFQQQQQEQHQHRFTVMSTSSPEKRAKEAARLLEKNHRRRQMLLVASRHQYLLMREQALGLQRSINSVFDKLALPIAHAAEPPKAQFVVSAANDDESNKDSNPGIGIKPVPGSDAYLELMPENPIQKAATGVVAGGTDEIDIELADEQESHPIKENIKDKIERKDDEKESEEAEQTEDMKEEMWDEADSSILDEIWGGISIFGKTVGTTVAKGFKMVQKVVVGGGVNAPEGEL